MQNYYKIDGSNEDLEVKLPNENGLDDEGAEELDAQDLKAEDLSGEKSGGDTLSLAQNSDGATLSYVEKAEGEDVARQGSEIISDDQNSESFQVKNEDVAEADEADKKPSLYDTAKIFGVSEESLTSEFNAFKAAKLFKRMNLMLCDNKISDAELKNMIKSAAETGFESVTVLPTRVKNAVVFSEKKIPVRAAVCYPFGSEVLKVKIAALKAAVKSGATFVEIPFDVYALSNKKLRGVIKEWKTLVKKAGKKVQVIMVVDVDTLTLSEINSVVKICKDAGVTKIKTSSCLSDGDAANFTVGGVGLAFDGVKYEVALKNPTADNALLMFRSGAETFSTPNAISIAKEIKVILGC